MHDYFDEDNEFRGKLDSDPLPDEIARRAAEIRATWGADQEQKRREVPLPPWTVPSVVAQPGLRTTGQTRPRPPLSTE